MEKIYGRTVRVITTILGIEAIILVMAQFKESYLYRYVHPNRKLRENGKKVLGSTT